jgi:phosphoenolpyruvate synthase/pyruvate phosphate dikinase
MSGTVGDPAEIGKMQAALRSWVHKVASGSARGLRGIPAPALLSLLCASALSPLLAAATGIGVAGVPLAGTGFLSSIGGGILSGILTDTLERVRSGEGSREPGEADGPGGLDGSGQQVAVRIGRVLAAEDANAMALRAGIASLLAAVDAGGTMLRAALEEQTGRVRGEVLAAIGVLGADFAELGFLVSDVAQAAALIQRTLDVQGADVRAIIEQNTRQSADIRLVREDVAAIAGQTGHRAGYRAGGAPRRVHGRAVAGWLRGAGSIAGVMRERDTMTDRYVLGLEALDKTQVALAGGKGANLGELSRVEGIRVPAGFCVTTDAFRRIVTAAPGIDDRLDRLSRLDPGDRPAIRTLSAEIRQAVEGIAIPDDLAAAITRSVTRFGPQAAYAVRSSATAEDLPTASFAGQQDTYLNVAGSAAILQHVSRCWASLFTERAVTYRLRGGFGHRNVSMAVVVQLMVFPRAAGILFTADPVTSNRKVVCIEASFGLGEALVAGLVNPDVYQVWDGEVVARAVAAKERAIQDEPALTDSQIGRLAQLGRRIEAHFGHPQDIEGFQIDQSRPITALYPIPLASDQGNRVYVSVGHQQMMTDAMKPLGLSLWQLTTLRPMAEAGGRLFVDVTKALGSPTGRAGLLKVLGRSDPLLGDALRAIIERPDFIAASPDDNPSEIPGDRPAGPIETDPAIVAELIERGQASIATLKSDIQAKSGSALLDFILEDIQELRRVLFDPRGVQVIMAAMQASWRLNDRLEELLGEKNAVDTLTRSVANNVTSEMGLALLDVADVIRPYPDVVAFLEQVGDQDFLAELPALKGGREARDAIQAYLDKYGMRCVGEIDITRPRWSERPATLVPMILGNIKNFEPGAGQRRFEEGRRQAGEKEKELLTRLRALPDGEREAGQAKQAIDLIRTFIGYREYPKYGMISRYFVYKRALLDEAERLVQAHVLRDREDIFYLRFSELHDAIRTNHVDDQLIRERADAFRSYQALTPPRVLTSDGEVVAGTYRRDDIPAGALTGLPVSAGTVEGRARVILDMAEADLEAGDILVTAYTDPSWTPAFVAAKGLVTEVGGLMTHGAVIAREYGLPAVVGVQNATRLIRDGQRIRVHGTDGYVEILPCQCSHCGARPEHDRRRSSARWLSAVT